MTEASRLQIGVTLTSAFIGEEVGVTPRAVLHAAADAGVDFVQIGDHVSFHDGTGFDGLLHAAVALAGQESVPVRVGLYLLALRHPVLVARQLADLARLFPGRLALGVGVGGEDRHEFEVSGVDPVTRGRRTDEALTLLGELLTGESTTFEGEFFNVREALVRPAPTQRIPILVGGRSRAALRRAAIHGDGWLALWTSSERFAAAVSEVASFAEQAGRSVDEWQHGLVLWCATPGADGRGGARLAETMQQRYKIPFEKFSRWCPVGPPDELADRVREYAAAGCSHVSVTLPAGSPLETIEVAAEVRQAIAPE
ncbi:LLM class flavin-dependent oxidoreductase [Nocardioides jensenii]|uniref:LLM class flavin-dependent oxidoreductase n=1 Tax=Nocardioides jensenii TaxID=1843 RepID=UPI000832F844|nr:LLM class flavin-dependent oxidoreductase [Nocardioides jensenii]